MSNPTVYDIASGRIKMPELNTDQKELNDLEQKLWFENPTTQNKLQKIRADYKKLLDTAMMTAMLDNEKCAKLLILAKAHKDILEILNNK